MTRAILAFAFIFVAVGMFLNAPDYLTTGGPGMIIASLIFFAFVAIGIGGRNR
jgi:hypothetical protein